MAETIKGLNIKLGLDTTELDNGLKEINKDLKEGQKDLKAINNSLKFDPSNVSLWKEKQDKLNSILEITKKKLEGQNQKLEEAKKALAIGAISEEEFKALQRSIKYTETDITKLNAELEKTAGKIKGLGAIDVTKLNKIGTNLTKYVTVPILGAVSALGALTIKSMETADAIADNASKAYLSAEAYQKWSHTFKLLAADEAVLQKTFVKLNGILGDIASGNGSRYEEYLNKIGLSTNDLIGLDSDQAFSLIRDSLSSLEDQTLRVAVANELFGDKIGAELAQVIGATAGEIDNLHQEVASLGVVTSEQAEQAGKFNDSLDNLKKTISVISVEIGITFLPILQGLVDVFQNKMVPIIRSVISWWSNLSNSTKKFIGILLAVAAAIGPFLVAMSKALPLIDKLKTGLALFKSGGMFAGLGIGKLAIIGLVATLAVLLLQNEKFRETLVELGSALKEILNPIIAIVGELVERLVPVINILMELVKRLIDALVVLLQSLLDPLIQIIRVVVEVAEVLLAIIIDLAMQILPPLMKILDVVINLILSLVPIIEMLIDIIGNVLVVALNLVMAILDPITKIFVVLVDIIGVVANVLAGLIEAIIKPLNKVLEVLAILLGVVGKVIEVVANVIAAILTPILDILIAVLIPIIELIAVIVEAIGSVMEVMMPLIDILLLPLMVQLEFIKILLEAFAPLLGILGEVINAILAPALTLLFNLLEPVLWVLTKIIDAAKWIIDNIANIFEKVGGALGKVGNFFGDLFSGRLFQSNATNNQTKYTTNNVTVNTSSATYDIGSIDRALGGAY